ncbi:hypothetical protein RRG08_018843 [Elysia crispata]|uniref:Uncharacterized protein n=1 Tax=Elysia crispata TaxID=231223 RepID=A0AAE1EBU1_9GAST|nr:hypothetical protein RRG08_018843 [Elysia crispata]
MSGQIIFTITKVVLCCEASSLFRYHSDTLLRGQYSVQVPQRYSVARPILCSGTTAILCCEANNRFRYHSDTLLRGRYSVQVLQLYSVARPILCSGTTAILCCEADTLFRYHSYTLLRGQYSVQLPQRYSVARPVLCSGTTVILCCEASTLFRYHSDTLLRGQYSVQTPSNIYDKSKRFSNDPCKLTAKGPRQHFIRNVVYSMKHQWLRLVSGAGYSPPSTGSDVDWGQRSGGEAFGGRCMLRRE